MSIPNSFLSYKNTLIFYYFQNKPIKILNVIYTFFLKSQISDKKHFKTTDRKEILRTEYEDKYKEALSRLRSTRLANRNGSKQHEINAIEREVKHISKEVARFGVQINNYDNEIEFMQTEAYLIDIAYFGLNYMILSLFYHKNQKVDFS